MFRKLLLVYLLFVVVAPVLAQEPSFDEMTFALDHTVWTYDPIDTLTIFPAGIERLIVIIPFINLPPNSTVDMVWSRDGEVIFTDTNSTLRGTARVAFYLNETDDSGLPAGSYTGELSYNGEIVARALTTLSDKPFVYPLETADDCTNFGNILLNPVDTFPSGTVVVVVRVRYANFGSDTPVTAIWNYGTDDPIAQELTFTGTDSQCIYLYDFAGLIDGDVRVEIVDANDFPLSEGTFTIGE